MTPVAVPAGLSSAIWWQIEGEPSMADANTSGGNPVVRGKAERDRPKRSLDMAT